MEWRFDREAGSGLARAFANSSLPYLWPRNSLELRVRTLIALALLIAAKLVNIIVPFFLKAVIDQVSPPSLAAVPLAALVAYGAARLGAPCSGRCRTRVFAKVGSAPVGAWRCAVYDHLFQLSLAYHLQRRTGELSRAIERGVKAISFLLTTAMFSLAPALVEFVLVIVILLGRYPLSFAGITFAHGRGLRRVHRSSPPTGARASGAR